MNKLSSYPVTSLSREPCKYLWPYLFLQEHGSIVFGLRDGRANITISNWYSSSRASWLDIKAGNYDSKFTAGSANAIEPSVGAYAGMQVAAG